MSVIGHGAVFKRWDALASTGEWDAITGIKSIGGIDLARDSVEATTYASTGKYREFISGLRDAGEFSMTVIFSQSRYQTLLTDYEDDDNQFYRIELPDSDSTIMEFEGLITGLNLGVPIDDQMTAELTIKISGRPVLTGGDSASTIVDD